MGRKVSGIVLTLLLTSMLTSTFNLTIADIDELESIGSNRITRFSATQAVDWWPMHQHDPRHSGYSTSKAPMTSRIEWNSTLHAYLGATGIRVLGLSASDDVVFVNTGEFSGGTPGRTYALNLTTGEEIWYFTLAKSVFYGAPAVAYGLVFTVPYWQDAGVYALNQTNGAQVWKYSLPSNELIREPPTVTDGMVFFGSSLGVFSLNATTGQEIWNYTSAYKPQSSPAVAGGMVFVSGSVHDHNVYALNETSGEKIWNYTMGDERTGWCAPSVDAGLVFVGSDEMKIYALNCTTGFKVWSQSLTELPGRIAVAYNKVFVSGKSARVYAFDALTGHPYWTKTVNIDQGGNFPGPPLIAADDLVFVGTGGDGLLALNESTGGVVWQAEEYFWDVVIADGRLVSHGQSEGEWVTVCCFADAHDVAITDVEPSKTSIIQNETIFIHVDVLNDGSFDETTNVTALYNSSTVGTQEVFLMYGFSTTLTLLWNTTGVAPGNYTISASASVVANETDTLDNAYVDGTVTVRLPVHDVAVVDVPPSKTVVGQGLSMNITVTVENQGDFTETFNVTVFYNDTAIALPDGKNHTTLALTSGNSTTLTIPWKTADVAKGNYTIKAKATPVPGETDTADNTFMDGWVSVAMVGDIAGPEGCGIPDGKCDIRDVACVARIFGIIHLDPEYDPNCDLTGPTFGVPDGKIDIRDVALVAVHFGDIDP